VREIVYNEGRRTKDEGRMTRNENIHALVYTNVSGNPPAPAVLVKVTTLL
jgi:hypothetical protein